MAGQFIKLPKELLAREDMILVDKIVLAYLMDKTGSNGHCWPGGRTIARELGVDKSTIFAALDRLANLSEITIIPGRPGQVNKYQLSVKSGQSCIPDGRENPDSQLSVKSAGVSVKSGQKCPENPDVSDRPKKRPIKKTQVKLANIPFELDTPEFRETWTRFHQNRREIKHPLRLTSETALLKELAGWGLARALAATEHSIRGGYQGVFEPKDGNPGGSAPAPEGDLAARYDRLAAKAKEEMER